MDNFKAITNASSNLLKSNQEHPLKKWFFCSNPYKSDVKITSPIEMLELPIFGHMTTCTMSFELLDKFLLVTSGANIKTSSPLFQNTFILRRPRMCHVIYTFFRSSLGKVQLPSFIIVGYVLQTLARGHFWPPPLFMSSPKKAHPE